MTRKDFEIMAPAGSFESLHAAIQGGADSVYFGAGNLNMRSRSSANFSADDLKEIARICRENGLKSYLTLNISLYDQDLQEMRRMVDVAVESEISAIIASDIAAIQYAYSRGMEVHLSTQCNVSNIEALKFYSNYADVVVLARELNMDQVKAIHEAIERDQVKGPKGELVRIEMFAHGALCMAVSGKCYLSLHQMNSSANRGACLQPCRRGYVVTEKETGDELEVDNEYIMSPKDLKTIHFLNRMIDARMRVFKIEGRARGPEYVKTVCATTMRPFTPISKRISVPSASRVGTAVWLQFLTGVFGTAIIWDSAWASGVPTTAHWPPIRRFIWAKPPTTSPKSAWPNLLWRPRILQSAMTS